MKRAAYIVLAWMFLIQTSFAAFYGNTQWEVRTTGSDDNGGGFAFGRTNIEANLLDLVINGSNNKVVTSAGHNFVAGDVGKYILMISTSPAGWIPGWYRIVSTASNAATLHESPGAVGLTGGDGNLYYGIDRSQQDATYYAYTDIVIGVTTTQATSAARPFSQIDEGNIINITGGAGCTVQRVQITSVGAPPTAAFDKSLGTAASTCTGNLGGALLTPNTMASLAVTGNEAFIKSGTYVITAKIALANKGIMVHGYGTTRGDGGTKPLITTATDSIVILESCAAGLLCAFDNLSLSNTASTREAGLLSKSGNFWITNCLFDGFTIGINGSGLVGANGMQSLIVSNTEVKNSSSYGVAVALSADEDMLIMVDDYIHDNTTYGVYLRTRGLITAARNRIVDNTGVGIYSDHGGALFQLTNNTIANNTGSGFEIAGGPVKMHFLFSNNIFYGNGDWGVEVTYGTPTSAMFETMLNANNAYGSNTSGNHTFIGVGANEVTLTADPFTNAAGGDFTLNSDAGGGELCKATGTPAYLDIGALQSQGAVAGAHGSAFVQ